MLINKNEDDLTDLDCPHENGTECLELNGFVILEKCCSCGEIIKNSDENSFPKPIDSRY